MSRITENDILIPALYIVYKNKSATTTIIKEQLVEMFRPTGEDAEVLQGRNDTKFTQIVRNLTGSHYSSNRFGELTTKNANKFSLTPEGNVFIEENVSQCEYISNNFFTYNENIDIATKIHKSSKTKHNLIIYKEDDIINEGKTRQINIKQNQDQTNCEKQQYTFIKLQQDI